MILVRYLWTALLTIFLLYGTQADAVCDGDAPRVQFRKEPGILIVTIGGKPFATYHYADKVTIRPYFKDVHAPGGIQATRNFPPVEGYDRTDHATFHPGIWMAFWRHQWPRLVAVEGKNRTRRVCGRNDCASGPRLLRGQKPLPDSGRHGHSLQRDLSIRHLVASGRSSSHLGQHL